MPLSSRSGTMKCVLLRTMSGTDNPVDRYLPVSSATCNSLVVIIGPPKKWNLCSILSLEGRIFLYGTSSLLVFKRSRLFFYTRLFSKEVNFFIWDFLPAGFQKKSTFFFIRDCFQKKSTFFFSRDCFQKKSTFYEKVQILEAPSCTQEGCGVTVAVGTTQEGCGVIVAVGTINIPGLICHWYMCIY